MVMVSSFFLSSDWLSVLSFLWSCWFRSIFFFLCALGKDSNEQNRSSIHLTFSQAVKESSKIIMTKNYVGSDLLEASITAEKKLNPKWKSTGLWPHHGYFKKSCCDEFSLQKENMPKLTFYYLNQGSLSYKNNEKIFHYDNYILDQIVPLANLPSSLTTYELKPDEVKILITKYNVSTGQFLGIVRSVSQLIAGVIRIRYFPIMGTLRKKARFSIVPKR